MSWATGYCEECKRPCDYRWSWEYEKPDGLESVDGRLLCGMCRKALVKKTHIGIAPNMESFNLRNATSA